MKYKIIVVILILITLLASSGCIEIGKGSSTEV